jgi:hypothetical protein
VQPGAEVVANATMLRGGTLTGLVTDQDDKPVGGVQMRAYAPDRGYEYAVSDSLGRYTFRGLDDDDYRIEAIPGSGRLDLLREWYNDKASYDTATVVPVGNGKTVTADFALEQGALVSGVVTDDGGPVAGIGVDVFDLNGNKSLTAWTNAEGKYMSSALPAGEYKVRFMPGYYGGDGLVEQWWEDRTTEANAKIIYLSAKEHKTGVDARLRPIGNATVPGAPTGVTASAGDEQVILQWQAPVNNGGLAITRYRVEGVPDGGCQTLGKLSCVIEDLDNGQSYQFTVRASNSAGLSLQSTASAAVVPFGKPKPPTAVIATAGVESAAVSWTPGNANGRPITSYTVTSAPGGKTCTTGTTSCTVAGLTGGTAYTFTVRARNDAGDSAASDASAPVTPGGPVAPPAGPPAAGGTGGGVGATPPPSGGAIPPVTAAPSAPSKVKTSVKKRKLRASWASSPTATSYKVRISPAKKPTKGTWKTVSKPSYSSGKLKKGKYVLQVKALGPGGESPVAKITIRVK